MVEGPGKIEGDRRRPDELDALNAAPQYHVLLFENEFVRVLDTRVPPAQTVPSTPIDGRAPSTFRSWSDFARRDAKGLTVVDSRTLAKIPEDSALWSGPLPPHMLENVGNLELRAISVEPKNTN